MADCRLMKTQKNQVLELIWSAGLDPAAFAWKDRKSSWSAEPITILIHAEREYFFAFERGAEESGLLDGVTNWAVFSPGQEKREETCLTRDWTNQLHFVRRWLKFLAQELDAPDLWADLLLSERELLNSSGPETPFTTAEQSRAAAVVQDVKAKTIALVHDPDAQRRIEAKLDHLIAAAERGAFTKKDWRLLAIGTGIDIAAGEIMKLLGSEQAKVWWHEFLETCFRIFDDLPPLLQ